VILKENDKKYYDANIRFVHKRIDISQYEWTEFQLYKPAGRLSFYMSASSADDKYLTDDPGAFPIKPYVRGSFFFGDR